MGNSKLAIQVEMLLLLQVDLHELLLLPEHSALLEMDFDFEKRVEVGSGSGLCM